MAWVNVLCKRGRGPVNHRPPLGQNPPARLVGLIFDDLEVGDTIARLGMIAALRNQTG